ncbi:hypothetical protein PR048_002645 [Dryococelus australis]|uniref:Uncharacterized protein n=1 Tax=Dryococelus australis TaxID=614101 RepID=A0ABQ9IKW6_9NEOP|nr:hypothetical protein PR048_002645 [Dryococelus australis]
MIGGEQSNRSATTTTVDIGCPSYLESLETPGGPGFDSLSSHPDFGFPLFPEIMLGECWDGSLTKAMADSFPYLTQSLFPVQLAPSPMTSLSTRHGRIHHSHASRSKAGLSKVLMLPRTACISGFLTHAPRTNRPDGRRGGAGASQKPERFDQESREAARPQRGVVRPNTASEPRISSANTPPRGIGRANRRAGGLSWFGGEICGRPIGIAPEHCVAGSWRRQRRRRDVKRFWAPLKTRILHFYRFCETTPERNGRGKRESPEKTGRPTASSRAIPTGENPGETQPGIEPGSPWWEASRLTAPPPKKFLHSWDTSTEVRSPGFSIFRVKNKIRLRHWPLMGEADGQSGGMDCIPGGLEARTWNRDERVSLIPESLGVSDRPGGHGGVVVRLLPSHHGATCSISGGVTPGFSHVGIVPESLGFLGILSFPPPLHSSAAPYPPRFNLIGSQQLSVQSRPNLFNRSLALVDPVHRTLNTEVLRDDEGEFGASMEQRRNTGAWRKFPCRELNPVRLGARGAV